MSIRTYNPSVRVGNWNEDIWLEEDLLKDFVQKRENGELLIQKAPEYYSPLLRSVTLSHTSEGVVSFGDVISLHHPHLRENLTIYMTNNQLYDTVNKPKSTGVTTSKALNPRYRNTFTISCQPGSGAANGQPLLYGQKFFLSTLPGDVVGDLKLSSERATLYKSAKKSRHNEVSLTANGSYESCWHVVHFDPQQRLESEGSPVPVDTKVVVMHSKTNEALSALEKWSYSTPFGKEHEVTAHTFLDSHKAEEKENHWVFVSSSGKK